MFIADIHLLIILITEIKFSNESIVDLSPFNEFSIGTTLDLHSDNFLFFWQSNFDTQYSPGFPHYLFLHDSW